MKFTLTKKPRRVSDLDIIRDLNRVARITGKNRVPVTDYLKFGKYGTTTVQKHFGSWNGAIRNACLRPVNRKKTPKLELYCNLKRVWVTLGREPKRKEMKSPLSEYSWRAYRDRFGSFTRSLEEFVKHANKRRVHKLKSPLLPVNPAVVKNRTNRQISYRLRHKILERDGYKCVKCGNSPAYGGGVHLQIDHIRPYSKGGETILENLQTLCKECNLGKGNR